MAAKKYLVTLTDKEKDRLKAVIKRGKHSAEKRKRAQALLLAGRGYIDEVIAEQTGMHRRGIEELRQRFSEEGFEVTLEGKPRGHRPRSIQGEDETRLITLVRGPVPDGYKRWTLRLIRDTWATLENTHTKEVSHETIRRILKKTSCRLH
ncbi:MAG: helix-turn-helix domain-containing protein [Spirochaetaceae bacterium]|nr:helix-turn-helix domain-containing protein [Spirochaetaceae bacterium]